MLLSFGVAEMLLLPQPPRRLLWSSSWCSAHLSYSSVIWSMELFMAELWFCCNKYSFIMKSSCFGVSVRFAIYGFIWHLCLSRNCFLRFFVLIPTARRDIWIDLKRATEEKIWPVSCFTSEVRHTSRMTYACRSWGLIKTIGNNLIFNNNWNRPQRNSMHLYLYITQLYMHKAQTVLYLPNQQVAVLRSHGWFSASAAVIRLLGSVTSNFATKSLASLERKIEEGGKLKRPLEMIWNVSSSSRPSNGSIPVKRK